MRPTISELLAGISRTINTTALPMALNSGDKEAFVETYAIAKMLAYVESRWDTEFARLARENAAMENLLGEAGSALQAIEHPAGKELATGIESPDLDIDSLPSISSLQEQNVNMKERIERFILIHAEISDGGKPELQAARRAIRDFLKEITLRDLEAAELLLTP
jgi:hypothetical protein